MCFFVFLLRGGGFDLQDLASAGFASEGIFKPRAWQKDQAGNGPCSLTTAEDTGG